MSDINEETCIKFLGDWEHPLAKKFNVKSAFFKSIAMDFKLPDSIRYMEGMSGKKYRYLINNLIESVDNARYLEIGSWAGSTACSAMYGNKCKVTCIDNWSQFGGPKHAFIDSTNSARSSDIDFQLIENDFRAVDYNTIGKYNVYMFDGPHLEQDQYDGVVVAQPALDNEYLLVVDDWNGLNMQDGTWRAIKDLGFNVIASLEIVTRNDGHGAKVGFQNSDWHNGYLFAVISKG